MPRFCHLAIENCIESSIFFYTNKIPTVITQFRAYTMVRSTAKPDHVMFMHTSKLCQDSAISHLVQSGLKWLEADSTALMMAKIWCLALQIVYKCAGTMPRRYVCLLASQGYDLCPIRELWLMGSKSLRTNLGSAKRYDIWESMPFQGYDLRGRRLYNGSIMVSLSIFFVSRSPVSSISSAAECSRAFLLSCFCSVILPALPSSFPHPPASFSL